jgi:hypothetical protein
MNFVWRVMNFVWRVMNFVWRVMNFVREAIWIIFLPYQIFERDHLPGI